MDYIQEKQIIGLTTEEVNQRIKDGKVNIADNDASKTVSQIIRSNVFTYFNFIFAIIAAALIVVGEFKQLTFLIVIFANTMIGIIQELNSKRTLDKLSLLNSQKSAVIRNGQEQVIETADIVLDDILVIGSGNQISVDCELLYGSVKVNESLITGEADEIIKNPGDKLVSGSFAVSGKCCCIATAVGEDSFASKMTADAKKMNKQKRKGMMLSLSRLVLVIGIAIIPLAGLMIYNNFTVHQSSLRDSVVTTAGALLGMIPEGLYLLTSIALAVSVIRLAKKNTLVHELGCIESLARVDVLCVDKTGTITEPSMNVKSVVALDLDMSDGEINSVFSRLVGNLDADNDTMRALYDYFSPNEVDDAISTVPFNSALKYSAASFDDGNFVIGAPEFILSERFFEYKSTVDEYTKTGSRVLMLAAYCGELDAKPLISELVFPIALVMLSNKVRENAKETFEFFNKNDVQIKVISGDDPRTASAAAIEAGIYDADNYISAATLKTDEEIYDAVDKYTVFGRVTPIQKRTIVQALKSKKHTVAMTGDGVNDILALKEADCSVAMASGSEVASQVSDLVLLDSDFSSMPDVVMEGRRVINNIERSASLFLVKNIFSFILALVSILALFTYPLSPNNLTLVSALTIGLPGFVLSLAPNTERVHGNFMKNVLYRAAPAAFTDLFCVIMVVAFRGIYNIPNNEASTMCTILLGTVGIIMLCYVCRPFNKVRIALIITMATAFLGGLIIFSGLFDIVPLSSGTALICGLLMLLSVPGMIAFRWVLLKLSEVYNKISIRNGDLKRG